MIKYSYKDAKLLFVGINPHFGSHEREVPFSNNKLFWYLLADAGLIDEKREDLRQDEYLKEMYQNRFTSVYGLGLVNMIDRPTRNISKLKRGEEAPGQKRLRRIIKEHTPEVICFIGKATYEKFVGHKDFDYGWQEPIGQSSVFLMHTPLRGKAIIRIHELRRVKRAIKKPSSNELIS